MKFKTLTEIAAREYEIEIELTFNGVSFSVHFKFKDAKYKEMVKFSGTLIYDSQSDNLFDSRRP